MPLLRFRFMQTIQYSQMQDLSSLTAEIYPNPVQSVLTVQLNFGIKIIR